MGASIPGFSGCFPGAFWLLLRGPRWGLGFDAGAGAQQQARQVNPVAAGQLFCLGAATEAVSQENRVRVFAQGG